MPGLDQLLCFSLYSTARAMGRVYQPLLDPLGLTYPQYLVMIVLWEQDAQPVGSIGKALGLDTNTLTPLLKRLQSAGLLERTRSATDERRVIVTLTDKGRDLQAKAAHIPRCVLEATGLSLDDALGLTHQITRLRDQLS